MKTKFMVCIFILGLLSTLTAQIPVATLAQLRTAADTSDYIYTGKADITYYDAALHHYFIQDETAAIFLDDYSTHLAPQFIRGAGISQVLGNLHDYDNNTWFLIQADATASSPIGITPQVVSITEFNSQGDDLESELVTLENVYFTDADSSTVFETGTNYDLQSAPGGSVVICKTQFHTANYIGAVIPGDHCNITGLVTESSGTYYITPRDSADFEFVETEKNVQFNVDMSDVGIIESDKVYVTGDFVGWSQPGGLPELMLTDPDGDQTYSVTVTIDAERIEYKYFLNAGWDGGEWSEENNRIVYLYNDVALFDVWGDTSAVYVEVPGPLGGGTGTQEDPWLIYTAEHLDSVRYYCSTWEDGSLSHFLLMNDLDLGVSPWADGSGWDPIGNESDEFIGFFNGNGKTVSGLSIWNEADSCLGLFAHNTGVIEDLSVEDAMIISSHGQSGILAGMNELSGVMTNCHVEGEVMDTGNMGKMGGLTAWNRGVIDSCSSIVFIQGEGGRDIGGLIGCNFGGILTRSTAEGLIMLEDAENVGGLVGNVENNTQLSECVSSVEIHNEKGYNTGGLIGSAKNSIISTSSYTNSFVDILAGKTCGGLVGYAEECSIIDCYSIGNIESREQAGGLVGFSHETDIAYCYSTGKISACINNVGGLIGYAYEGSVTDCFWDIETSRIKHSAGGMGKTSAEMTDPLTYSAWSTGVTWLKEAETYPYLFYQMIPKTYNYPVAHDENYQIQILVDMADVADFDPSADILYISGSFAGWPEPGSDENYRLTQLNDSCSSAYISLEMPAGVYEYKYFKNGGWDGSEWIGDPNRVIDVQDYTIAADVYSVLPDTSLEEMVYVSSVIRFSSQIDVSDGESWQAEQVLGAPDCYPYYHDYYGNMWVSETPDADREYLELGLAEAGYVYGIFVYEIDLPGAIDSAFVRNADNGEWMNVWSGNAVCAGSYARIFPIVFEKTTYQVDAVRLEMNSSAISEGWNGIDAVAVAVSETSGANNDWEINIAAYWKEYQDIENYLGGSILATDGFDTEIDEVEAPPAPGEFVSCYFPHPEWGNPLGDNFGVDIRELKIHSVQTWDFEVLTTDTGLTTLNFSGENVNANAVTLKDKTTGMEMALSEGFIYEFTAVADIAREFSITVGDTTPAELILSQNCSGPAIWVSGEEMEISWIIEHYFELSAVSIYLSENGGDYELIETLGADSSYTWTIPERDISQECRLKVVGRDTAGEIIMDESTEPFAIGGSQLFIIEAGWTLFGFPCEIEMSTEEGSKTMELPYVVLYEYVNGGYQIPELQYLGRGYWLGASENMLTRLEGLIQKQNVTADLDAGWNMISDPLITDVAVDSLIFRNNGEVKLHAAAKAAGWINELYGYETGSGYSTADNLEPWSGYWISVLDTGMTIEYPIHKQRQIRIEKAAEEQPLLAFHALSNDLRNDLVQLDINESATEGFDVEFDAVCPPASPSPSYLNLFVQHSDVDFILGNRFVTDVRQPATQSSYRQWDLKVETSEPSVNLSWISGTIPDGMQIAVDINGDGVYQNLLDWQSITVQNGDILPIRLGVNVVGIQELNIPVEYELAANYPNPFNPITFIDYAMPEKAHVEMTIYDMNGRIVKTLLDQEMTAGYHTVRWDGCNENGVKVGSGLYIYRLHSGNTVLSQKMLLMK